MVDPGLIITIARQNGSGGREVGRILSELTGIRCYDREMIAETARITGKDCDEVKLNEERPAHSAISFYGIEPMSPIFETQSAVIKDIAKGGPAIIVGRCADYILRDRDNVINVYVHADIDIRAKRSSERNSTEFENAKTWVLKTDDDRSRYYSRCTGRPWGLSSNYDIAIDTGKIGTKNAAELILSYLKMAGYEL